MNRREFLQGSLAASAVGWLTGCGGGTARVGRQVSAPASSETTASEAAPEEVTRSAGSDRAGLQLILMPHWSHDAGNTAANKSVNNFLAVFRDSRGNCTAGPKKLALSFCPYLYNPASSYGNARAILDALLAGGKDISVTVFLDRDSAYHRTGTVSDDADIVTSARDFTNNFLKAYAVRAAFSVSPSLEDNASNAVIDRWSQKIASAIGPDYLKYVAFRRCPESADNAYLPAQGGYRAVQLELHGGASAKTLKGAAYSNDGTFVAAASGETLEGSAPAYASMSSFAGAVRQFGYGGTVLLWRPAMNLLVRQSSGGRTNYTRTGRDLSDRQVSFDATEQKALRDFFAS